MKCHCIIWMLKQWKQDVNLTSMSYINGYFKNFKTILMNFLFGSPFFLNSHFCKPIIFLNLLYSVQIGTYQVKELSLLKMESLYYILLLSQFYRLFKLLFPTLFMRNQLLNKKPSYLNPFCLKQPLFPNTILIILQASSQISPDISYPCYDVFQGMKVMKWQMIQYWVFCQLFHQERSLQFYLISVSFCQTSFMNNFLNLELKEHLSLFENIFGRITLVYLGQCVSN